MTIDTSLCKGCEICAELCPRGVLEMSNEMTPRGFHTPKAVRPESCTSCGLCEMYCPDFAICVREEKK